MVVVLRTKTVHSVNRTQLQIVILDILINKSIIKYYAFTTTTTTIPHLLLLDYKPRPPSSPRLVKDMVFVVGINFLALTRRSARIGMGDGIDVFGVNGMPRSTDGGTWGKTSLTRWNPFMAIVVVVVEVLLGPTVGGIESFPNC